MYLETSIIQEKNFIPALNKKSRRKFILDFEGRSKDMKEIL